MNIYVISDGDAHKVGVSGHPRNRLRSIQTSTHKKLMLVATWRTPSVACARLAEQKLHAELTDRRIAGEWFGGDVIEIVSAVSRMVDALWAAMDAPIRRRACPRSRAYPTKAMEDGLRAAIHVAGSKSELARICGISRQAVHQWDKCPHQYVHTVVTALRGAVTAEQLRPDLNIK